jgi:hypothetical protein
MNNILLCLLLLLPALSFPATIALDTITGSPGGTVAMSLELVAGGDGLAAIQVDVLVNAPIAFVSASKGASAEAAQKEVSTSAIEGGVRLLIYGLNQNLFEDGVVANLTFSIAAGTADGDYPVVLANPFGSDENGASVPLYTDNGTIQVGGGSGGDCSGTPIFIAASAHAVGANESVWRTDLALLNGGSSAATISMKYLPRGADNSSTPCVSAGTVSAAASKGLNDVVLAAFGVNAGAGGIAIYSDATKFSAMSRTYNQAPEGTYGQGIPARAASSGILAGQTKTLLQLHENTAYRTNVGFLNTSSGTTQLTAYYYNESGSLLGNLPYTLKPYEMLQEDQAFKKVTPSAITNGRVEVTVNSGSALAYASVTDNITGDPTYIEPM